MKIRKGPAYGYYVDELAADVMGKVLPVQPIPSDFPLQMKFNQEGMDCPLPEFATLTVTDLSGRRFVLKGGDWNMLQAIWAEDDSTLTRVDMIDLDPENGVWYFLNGVPIDKVGK